MLNFNNISPDSQDFSQIVTTIAKPPKRLWFVGKLPKKRLPTVAIVGTRKPTPYGHDVCYKLAYELAQKGVVIISGLALGTDAIAHTAALDAGGITIAVMAGGLDRIHPQTNRQLAIRIVQNRGALVSEYAPGEPIYRSNFIARNRIVSGLSDGLLIAEATAKSGTMHTAGFALEQGRTVMAVPGNITSPASEGCNNLIRTGAIPVANANDVLQALGLDHAHQQQLPLGATAEEQAILTLITRGVRDGDQLMTQASLTPPQFSQALTMLEITGKIRALGANQWSIK